MEMRPRDGREGGLYSDRNSTRARVRFALPLACGEEEESEVLISSFF